MNKKELLKSIGKLRQELHELMKDKDKFDEEVIKKSQQLDRLLTEYQKLLNK